MHYLKKIGLVHLVLEVPKPERRVKDGDHYGQQNPEQEHRDAPKLAIKFLFVSPRDPAQRYEFLKNLFTSKEIKQVPTVNMYDS